MFTPGGQIDLLSFAGVRGGKGGGGGDDARFTSRPLVLTDPVNGKTFTQETNPYLFFQNSPGAKSAQEQLNEEIAQRQADEKAASDKAAADAAAKAQAAETTFQGNRQTAYNDALAAVQRQFQLQGVDPAAYMTTDIQPTLQRQFNSIQDLDPNPAAAFPSTLGDQIIGNITTGKRTQANSALSQLFSPTFATDLIPDSTSVQAVNDIINEQFNPLSQQLVNAQKRNLLSPVGYQAALDALAQKKSAATSDLQSRASGILDTERQGINDIISGARTTANSLGLADTFDPGKFGGQAQSKAASDISGFGGALRSAVGDTKFADLTDLLNAGGIAQGATNPFGQGAVQTTPGASPFATTPEEQAKQRRGLGNVGAF